MDPSVKYALFAMALIGAGDAINKRSRQAGIPIGSYLLIQTIFFTCTIFVIALITTGIRIMGMDILYSLVGAIVSFAAFTLMLHSLTYGHASVNYAIFRLSFVLASGAAIIFLGEILTTAKIIGIILATIAILIFFYNPKQQVVSRKPLALALCAMMFGACFQFTLKLATQVYSSSPSFLLLMSLFFSSLVVVYYIISRRPPIPGKIFLYAPVNGILMATGSLFLIIALSEGDVSVVTPIVQLSFLLTMILSVMFLKEKITVFHIIGILCAAIAVTTLGWL